MHKHHRTALVHRVSVYSRMHLLCCISACGACGLHLCCASARVVVCGAQTLSVCVHTGVLSRSGSDSSSCALSTLCWFHWASHNVCHCGGSTTQGPGKTAVCNTSHNKSSTASQWGCVRMCVRALCCAGEAQVQRLNAGCVP